MAESKKILAVDYGKKFIGFALSDSKKRIAFPYKIIHNKGKKAFLKELRRICQENNVEKVIFGLPLSLSGGKTKETEETITIVNYLKERLVLSLELVDERMSTKLVQRVLSEKNKRKVDDLAAVVILQSYLAKNKEKTNN